MKITVFQSDKGDCLLLTSARGANLLVDGGMASAYQSFVAPALGKLRQQGGMLDLVCVSHIDEDHIAGILELVNNLLAWRVHDFQVGQGNAGFKKPGAPRPPEIGGIWHNAFGTLLKDNAGPVEDLLAQSSTVLSLATGPLSLLAEPQRELAASVKQAIQLSRRIAASQLNIPLNAAFDGHLALVRSPAGPDAKLGGMNVSVIGPFASDIANLRDEWNAWLRNNKAAVRALLAKARADAERLGLDSATAPLSELALATAGLGDRTKVTTPNLASLMLLVEEGRKSVLLTGDGHADDILEGLEHHGQLDGDRSLHVDVLKVQHHGSEHNMTEEFADHVSADHYIFCGNGKHENPDLRVVELICQSRLKRQDGRHFKLWFNASTSVAPAGKPRQHMRDLEMLVSRIQAKAGGLVDATFLGGPALGLEV